MPFVTSVEEGSITTSALLLAPKLLVTSNCCPTIVTVTPVSLALSTSTQDAKEFVFETVEYRPVRMKSEFKMV